MFRSRVDARITVLQSRREEGAAFVKAPFEVDDAGMGGLSGRSRFICTFSSLFPFLMHRFFLLQLRFRPPARRRRCHGAAFSRRNCQVAPGVFHLSFHSMKPLM
jgi:hypothetical protein